MKVIKTLYFLLCALLCTALTACSKASSDGLYFSGLQKLKADDIELARKEFTLCVQNGTPLFARKSLEALLQIDDVKTRQNHAMDLVESYGDDLAIQQAANIFLEAKEYQKVIRLTDNIDIKSANSETVYARLVSMRQKKDSRFWNEFFVWNENAKYTKEHYEMYREVLFELDEAQDTTVLYKFRAAVFVRDYQMALDRMQELKYLLLHDIIKPTKEILSDMGKTSLYCGKLYDRNAKFFCQLATGENDNKESTNLHPPEKPLLGPEGASVKGFVCAFYAARCFTILGQTDEAVKWFEFAMRVSPTHENYDNAFWYYLDTLMNVDASRAVNLLACSDFTMWDKDYFDDFFELLSYKLLVNHRYSDYYKVYQAIEQKASGNTVSQYAYICARMIEEGLLSSANSEDSIPSVRYLFTRAVRANAHSKYYVLLAAKKLEIKNKEFLFATTKPSNSTQEQIDNAICRLVGGYAECGLSDFVVSQWQKSKDAIDMQTTIKIASFLRNYGSKDTSYYRTSLNVINSYAKEENAVLNLQVLQLLYPRNFIQYIAESANEFGIKEYLLLSLILTESYFDPEAKSAVGALGLTQLMPSTTHDIMQVLKDKDANIMDAKTNIRFGAYYLNSLIQRLGQQKVLGVAAYNCGITRVKGWVKKTALDMATVLNNKTGQVPTDIFIETIPYLETRDYCRKIVANACMYAALYYDCETSTVLEEML